MPVCHGGLIKTRIYTEREGKNGNAKVMVLIARFSKSAAADI